VTADELDAAWRHHARYPWLVAEISGTPIGYAKAGTWRERAAYQWTTEVGLYLDPELRGRGVGTQLYAELLAELVRRGFRSAIAGIALPNPPSIALHRRAGFVSVGIVREAGYKHDRWHDVEFWQKRLADGTSPPVTVSG
jgi:L-amino acid N-acyltransferase YncA